MAVGTWNTFLDIKYITMCEIDRSSDMVEEAE